MTQCGFTLWLVAFMASAAMAAQGAERREIPLSSLDLSGMPQGWGTAQIDKSVEKKPLKLHGTMFEHGVGSHAASALHLELDGKAIRFRATVGVDDETEGKGSIRFKLYGDELRLFDSGVVKGGEAPRAIDVDLRGVKRLVLVVTDGGDDINWDHADWCDAVFEVEGAAPRVVSPPHEEPIILTPPPGPAPKINGPRLYGARPGHPFVYRIPTTGTRPMKFSAEKLPSSLQLDARTGIISGQSPATRGEYVMKLRAENEHGTCTREWTLVVGDTLALTPPMGWNSWYIHYHRVSDENMRAAADAMVKTGMADFGYEYVDIDDCWMKRRGDEPYRGEDGAILTNDKFPDMTALCDYIHAKGLKAGIYTSPGPWTCAGFVGTYEHEEIDARQFAKWGFDFLKYDWCSYESVATGEGRKRLMRPYTQMGKILANLDRDIVFNLCQYGMGDVWEWGAETGGNCWRTTGDLGVAASFYTIGLSNAQHYEFAGPGRWNDPDYLMIGWVGDARTLGEGEPANLTPSEQYSYMAMWCLMASPLFYSGDVTKLDDFTLNILCNAEVIAVDQDPLGRQARIIRQNEDELVLAKPLEDGSLAVGLFNLAEISRPVSVKWSELGLSGPQMMRDLWRQQDLGKQDDGTTAQLARHGVLFVRVQAAAE